MSKRNKTDQWRMQTSDITVAAALEVLRCVNLQADGDRRFQSVGNSTRRRAKPVSASSAQR